MIGEVAWVCAPMLTAFLRALDSCAPGSSSGLGAPVIESHSESSHSESSAQNPLVHTLTWYGMVWHGVGPPPCCLLLGHCLALMPEKNG